MTKRRGTFVATNRSGIELEMFDEVLCEIFCLTEVTSNCGVVVSRDCACAPYGEKLLQAGTHRAMQKMMVQRFAIAVCSRTVKACTELLFSLFTNVTPRTPLPVKPINDFKLIHCSLLTRRTASSCSTMRCDGNVAIDPAIESCSRFLPILVAVADKAEWTGHPTVDR